MREGYKGSKSGVDYVLKVGGSLIRRPKGLIKLCRELAALSKVKRLLIVPGGASFANVVRRCNAMFNLKPLYSHWMALLAMDQYGLLLASITRGAKVIRDLNSLDEVFKEGKLLIILPSSQVLSDKWYKASWGVTSDTIAARMAGLLNLKEVILVKDVDGIFMENPKVNPKAPLIRNLSTDELKAYNVGRCIDKCLPIALREFKLTCYIVNGLKPRRVRSLILNKRVLCTTLWP